jgi:hypothetical protein
MNQQSSATREGGTAANPVFYERPELLSAERHAGTSLAAITHHRFARATNSVALTGAEFASAQRNYPIVFSDEAVPFPMAIVGMRNAENLFIGAEGRWDPSAYIPAYVRRYPFIFMTGPDKTQFALCVDAASEFLSPGDDNPLFRAGAPTDVTKNALAFCASFQQEYEKTLPFAAALAEQKLLEPRTISIDLPDGQKLAFGPFRVVDEAKLGGLGEAVLADWLRRGWLAWIYAHLLSAANWNGLAQRVRAPL